MPRSRMGIAFMEAMLAELGAAGYAKVLLSVQKENPAVRLYRRLGFEAIGESDEEFLTVRWLGGGDALGEPEGQG